MSSVNDLANDNEEGQLRKRTDEDPLVNNAATQQDEDDDDFELGRNISNGIALPNKKSKKFKIDWIQLLLVLASIAVASVVIILCVVFGLLQLNSDPYNIQLEFSSSTVASDSPLCSTVGSSIMKEKGGNAMDAAIATAFCLGVTRPFASGIGGGGFMIVRMKTDQGMEEEFFDFRERAPLSSTFDMFINRTKESEVGGKAIAIPGEVKGMYAAHRKYGKIDWQTVMEPAIKLARDGFAVEPLLAYRIKQGKNLILENTGLKRMFTKLIGDSVVLLQEGDIVTRLNYARTLEEISMHGPDVFYSGDLAETIVQEIQQHGGNVSLTDFLQYDVRQYSPLRYSLPFSNVTVLVGDAPSAGPVVGFALSILDQFQANAKPLSSVDLEHVMIESLKHAFTHKMLLGDPNVGDHSTQVKDFVSKYLTSQDYAQTVSRKIDLSKTFEWDYYKVDFYSPMNEHGTTHLSVMDSDRNIVSLTSTVNELFGSCVVGDETGIIYNDEMSDFTVDPNKPNPFKIPPSKSNFIAPGKTPQSSMSPIIVLEKDGKAKFTLGASGGPTIISSILQIMVDVLQLKLVPQTAVNLPRIHPVVNQVELDTEAGFSQDLLNGLQAKGHQFKISPILPDGHTIGNVQSILVTSNDKLLPASDKRKLGRPAGF